MQTANLLPWNAIGAAAHKLRYPTRCAHLQIAQRLCQIVFQRLISLRRVFHLRTCAQSQSATQPDHNWSNATFWVARETNHSWDHAGSMHGTVAQLHVTHASRASHRVLGCVKVNLPIGSQASPCVPRGLESVHIHGGTANLMYGSRKDVTYTWAQMSAFPSASRCEYCLTLRLLRPILPIAAGSCLRASLTPFYLSHCDMPGLRDRSSPLLDLQPHLWLRRL